MQVECFVLGITMAKFFPIFFQLLREQLLINEHFRVYGFGVEADLESLKEAYKLVYKKNARADCLEIFDLLMNDCHMITKSDGLDLCIQKYYPNFKMDPLKRHNADYDVFLSVLCYIKEQNSHPVPKQKTLCFIEETSSESDSNDSKNENLSDDSKNENLSVQEENSFSSSMKYWSAALQLIISDNTLLSNFLNSNPLIKPSIHACIGKNLE